MTNNNLYQQAVEKFSGTKIAVIGDLMLDVYLWGNVSRISPEAPVPVVDVCRRTSCPGGAANVMRNISTCGGKVIAFGAIGNDQSGEMLQKELADLGVDNSGIVTSAKRRTTEKCRVIAGSQQLLRADFEDAIALEDDLREKMVYQIENLK